SIGRNLSAQIIEGRVLDYETKSAIPLANIYFNASSRGTTSDTEGFFSLDTDEYYGQDIVISYVGYKSLTIKEYDPDKFLEVYLQQQSTMLDELVIESDNKPRQEKLTVFLEQFLGDSPRARDCIINNLDELRLVYFESTGTLEGFSQKPLRIHNRALGYKITYSLDEFEASEKHFSYQGNSFFEEDTTLTESELRKVERKRRTVYYGSRMHFFRALWSGKLEQEGFTVISRTDGSELSASEIVESDSENKNIKYLLPIAPLRIAYERRQYTHIYFEGDEKVLFANNGFFDPQYLRWEGTMARHRISDLLPYGYIPE
ncbi:MAG: carboxypeptidase-like regulatory domain-containing protein, partial [Cyclobacteriaceae bacterium]